MIETKKAAHLIPSHTTTYPKEQSEYVAYLLEEA